MIYDTNDIRSLALVAWKEARGEGSVGMQAVMHVIVNRVGQIGFAHTLHDVIYGKNQFTSMSVVSDPEYTLAPQSTDTSFISALSLAKLVLGGVDQDITNGAHYYANLKTATSGWFYNHIVTSPDHPITATIGHHTFFK